MRKWRALSAYRIREMLTAAVDCGRPMQGTASGIAHRAPMGSEDRDASALETAVWERVCCKCPGSNCGSEKQQDFAALL